jgi:hypothetical protein
MFNIGHPVERVFKSNPFLPDAGRAIFMFEQSLSVISNNHLLFAQKHKAVCRTVSNELVIFTP